jgi:hypothetical protein
MRGCLHLHSDNAPPSRIKTHGILILLVAVHILASCTALWSSWWPNYVLNFARRDRSIREGKSYQQDLNLAARLRCISFQVLSGDRKITAPDRSLPIDSRVRGWRRIGASTRFSRAKSLELRNWWRRYNYMNRFTVLALLVTHVDHSVMSVDDLVQNATAITETVVCPDV